MMFDFAFSQLFGSGYCGRVQLVRGQISTLKRSIHARLLPSKIIYSLLRPWFVQESPHYLRIPGISISCKMCSFLLQGFAKVAFSRACWPLSMLACGDRKDFLQFLRTLPSRREDKVRRNCKREAGRILGFTLIAHF